MLFIECLFLGFGKCGVAVIRVSGSKAYDVATYVAGFKKPPEPRKVHLRRFRDPETKEIIDHGLFFYFVGIIFFLFYVILIIYYFFYSV